MRGRQHYWRHYLRWAAEEIVAPHVVAAAVVRLDDSDEVLVVR